MIIRPARNEEIPQLIDLARRSKSHWGYSIALLDHWTAEGAFTPTVDDSELTQVAEDENGTLLGWYQLSGKAPVGSLSDLWIDPQSIGKGVGRELFLHASQRGRELGFAELQIDSDPNAEDFYLHMGAVRIGETPPDPITKRVLPMLSLKILA